MGATLVLELAADGAQPTAADAGDEAGDGAGDAADEGAGARARASSAAGASSDGLSVCTMVLKNSMERTRAQAEAPRGRLLPVRGALASHVASFWVGTNEPSSTFETAFATRLEPTSHVGMHVNTQTTSTGAGKT